MKFGGKETADIKFNQKQSISILFISVSRRFGLVTKGGNERQK